ncbi:MAG: restriction endonuclease subunit S [Campylobacter hyointestinalis]
MKSPKIRFKEFNSEWNSTTLGDIFDYIRPDNYIVKSDKYSKNYNTPVLTANKAFILGYTNEKNTFNKECVIFDDFTLDLKYVNFPFMVKSSALKILVLKEKSFNFGFCYELLKKANIEILGHARHYISVVQPTKTRIPSDMKEQEAIGEFFRKIDEILDLEKLRFKKFENFKKTMLDKLFVASGENAPRLRLGSFTSNWTSVNLGELGEIIKGQQINKIDLLPSGKYYVLNGGVTPSGYTNSFNTNENIISISEGGSCGFVNFNKEKFWSGGHNYTLQNLVINTRFLYALLKHREKNIMSLGVGSGLQNIQKSSLLKFKIQIPTDLKEQEAIGEFFRKIDEILELSQNRISKLENIKKYLLNKMFV